MNRLPTKRGGFTLIEILVVMAILGILITGALASYTTAQMRGRDSKRKSDLRQIATALELYFNDNGAYPAAAANADSSIYAFKGCGASPFSDCNWGSSFNFNATTVYMPKLPKDPVSPTQYYRYKAVSGTQYLLFALLENHCDVDAAKDGSNNAAYYDTVYCGTSFCNYVLGSSDQTAPTPTAYSSPAQSCN